MPTCSTHAGTQRAKLAGWQDATRVRARTTLGDRRSHAASWSLDRLCAAWQALRSDVASPLSAGSVGRRGTACT